MTNKRHQVEERESFTEEEREKIAAKSDHKCVKCGKKVFFGYGATIDHYVPLKKGGTNDRVNLVMMCEDCNQAKGSKVLPINIAAVYLKPEYKSELSDYFENFLKSFEYLSRGNLLGADAYEFFVFPEVAADAANRLQRKGKQLSIPLAPSKLILTRAYPEDEDRLVEYFARYLKKYDMLDSVEAARVNIRFWMRFGAIYFVERNGEVYNMSTIMMSKFNYISVNLFSYYATKMANTLIKGIVTCIGHGIMEENDLPCLPVSVNMLIKDPLHNKIQYNAGSMLEDGPFCCTPGIMRNEEYDDEYFDLETNTPNYTAEMVTNLQKFFKRFKNIEDDMRFYLYENNALEFEWMTGEVLLRDMFHNYPEFDLLGLRLKESKNN